MVFYIRQLFGVCNKLINRSTTTNQEQSNLDTLNNQKSHLKSTLHNSQSLEPSSKQLNSSDLTYSIRPNQTDMIGKRRSDELIVQQDGRINENFKFDKVNKLAGLVVNERGQSHLINSTRNRSSSLYNGGTTVHSKANAINNLQCSIETEQQSNSINQRRNTSCSINMVNDNQTKYQSYLNDQTLLKQSNLLNETDNQLTKDQLIDHQQTDTSIGLFGSVWNYLSNIPKKRSPSKTRNSTIYNRLCNSLNSTPVHRLVKKDTKELYEKNKELILSDLKINNAQIERNEDQKQTNEGQFKKQCNCKCVCQNVSRTQHKSVLNIDDCLPSEIPARIHEMDSFPFQPHPPDKEIDKIDTEDWLRIGKEMVEYIAYYKETLDKRRVTPDVEPGYLKHLLPKEAPTKSQEWKEIMTDFERCILPGITNWQSNRFYAYFPAGNSFPSILADMLSDAIGCICFSWVS